MKLLVTGGAGFIGSNYVRYVLRETDDEVVVYAISALAPLSLKGILVNSYGIYADAMASEMMEKLNIERS